MCLCEVYMRGHLDAAVEPVSRAARAPVVSREDDLRRGGLCHVYEEEAAVDGDGGAEEAEAGEAQAKEEAEG